MSSVKTRKLDISTILAVVKAQTGSGATGPPVVGSAIIREIQPAGVGSSVSFSSNVNGLLGRSTLPLVAMKTLFLPYFSTRWLYTARCPE